MKSMLFASVDKYKLTLFVGEETERKPTLMRTTAFLQK